jgi:hypothetical protein
MTPTRARASAVVVGALVLSIGLAACGPTESCEEQDRTTLAELRAVWPDELGENDWAGGACDNSGDAMYLVGTYLVGTSSGSAEAAAVLEDDGWVLDRDYADGEHPVTVYRRTVAHHAYFFWVGEVSDTDLELERA